MKFNTNNLNGGSQQNMSTAFKSLVVLLATTGALRRIKIEEITGSAFDVPNATDCPIIYDLSLVTADGTGTGSAAQATDGPLETGTIFAANTTSKANYTAEPTVTANTSKVAASPNQRSLFRWAALSDDHRPTSPAIAASGFTLRAKSPNYNSTMFGQLNFSE